MLDSIPRVLCLACGAMVCPVIENGRIFYSAHYIPGGVDSDGFCPNVSEVPNQIIINLLREKEKEY